MADILDVSRQAGPGAILFHTGIVVDDLAESMTRYTEAFGAAWAKPITVRGEIQVPGGEHVVRESLITFSVGGSHHLELIQMVDPSAWLRGPRGADVNHIGYAIDDLPGETERLVGLGYVVDFHGIDSAGSIADFSYLRTADSGMYVELVDRRLYGNLQTWIAGGDELRRPSEDR